MFLLVEQEFEGLVDIKKRTRTSYLTSMGSFSSFQDSQLNTIAIVVSCFSLLGSCFVMVCFVAIPRLRNFGFKLVFMLACSEAFYSIAYLMGSPEAESFLCKLQALMLSFFSLSSLLWTSAISYTLVRSVTQPRRIGIHLKEPSFHIVAWGIPLILALLPMLTESYGKQDAHFCWIKNEGIDNFWRFFQFYVPLFACIVYNALCYQKASKTVHHAQVVNAMDQTNEPKIETPRRRSLLLYPLVLVVCWIFALCNRIQNLLNPTSPQFWLYLLQIVFSCLQGLLHAIVYTSTPAVRLHVFDKLRQICPDLYQESGDYEAVEGEDSNTQSHSQRRVSVVGLLAEHFDPRTSFTNKLQSQESNHNNFQNEDDFDSNVQLYLDADMEDDVEEKMENRELSQRHSLQDVSHQIRSTYMLSLGMFELIGIHPSELEGRVVYQALSHYAQQSTRRISDKQEEMGYIERWEEIEGEAEPIVKDISTNFPAKTKVQEQTQGELQRQKASVASTYITLSKSFIGLGILALPKAFSEAGYIGGTIGLSIIAWISYHCMIQLIECKRIVEETRVNEEKTVDASFSALGYYAMGNRGMQVVNICLVISQTGFSTAYLIFIGENIEKSLQFPKYATIMICACALLPLVWMKSLKRLALASLVADIAIMVGIVAVFVFDLMELANRKGHAPHSLELSTFPIFFGLAVYTFEGIGLVIPIQSAMQQPEKFPEILRNTMACLTVLFVAIGSISYVAYGELTQDVITLNLPPGTIVTLVLLFYCVGLYFTCEYQF